jgi:hypothetical protein
MNNNNQIDLDLIPNIYAEISKQNFINVSSICILFCLLWTRSKRIRLSGY